MKNKHYINMIHHENVDEIFKKLMKSRSKEETGEIFDDIEDEIFQEQLNKKNVTIGRENSIELVFEEKK